MTWPINVIPVCKSSLHRPRASRPLASRVEEEAVRDDARVVRTSVYFIKYSPAALGEAKTAGEWRLLPLHPHK